MADNRNPFVIYSSQRSGSTLLIHLLDQHPDIACAGEVYKLRSCEQILHPQCSFRYDKKLKQLPFRLFPTSVIRKHAKRIRRSSEKVFGFKLMVSQTDVMMQLPRILEEEGYKMIVLRRSDIVRQCLSVELARSSDSWVNEGGKEEDEVALDLLRLEKSLKYFQRCDRELERLVNERSVLELEYEAFTKDIPKSITEICDFLGVANDFTPKVELKKTSERTYSERIKNYPEVKTFFQQKGFDSLPE